MNPFQMTGIHNPFEAGVPFGALSYVPNPNPNNDAQNPTVGSYSYIPQQRQRLAQLMSEPYYGRGGRGGGGYTTSTGAAQGGWGRTAGGQRTSGIGGWGMGGRGGGSQGIGMGGRGSFF